MTRFDQIRQLQLVTSNLHAKLITNTKYPLQTRSAVYTFIALQPDTDSDMPIIVSPACILGYNCPGDKLNRFKDDMTSEKAKQTMLAGFKHSIIDCHY